MNQKTKTSIGCLVFLLGAPIFIWIQRRDFQLAEAAWESLPTSSVQVDYAVVDRHSEVTGSGKSRRTAYYIELGRKDPIAEAPPGVTIQVGPKVHEHVANGAVWRARLVDGQAHFDPLDSREELERSSNSAVAGLLSMIVAAVVLFLNLTGRLNKGR